MTRLTHRGATQATDGIYRCAERADQRHRSAASHLCISNEVGGGTAPLDQPWRRSPGELKEERRNGPPTDLLGAPSPPHPPGSWSVLEGGLVCVSHVRDAMLLLLQRFSSASIDWKVDATLSSYRSIFTFIFLPSEITDGYST